MAIYAQIIYHIVFTTKNRERTLGKSKRPELYAFIWEHLKARQCRLHRIGGTEDHVHLLISLHPAMALGALMKEIKTLSDTWVSSRHVYKPFNGWQDGYAAFTHALPERDRLIEHIKDQEELHESITFREEFEQLLDEAGLTIADDDADWFDAEEGDLEGGLYEVNGEEE